MDGKPAYPSSYPAPPTLAGPQYSQYNHGEYAGQSADPYGHPKPAPAAAAAAIDPNINYGYGPPPQPEPQIVIENSTVTNAEPGCECGVGWILFGVGWFIYLAWIVGAIMYCTPQKPRDRPGLLGCLIMSIIGGILIIIAIAANSAS